MELRLSGKFLQVNGNGVGYHFSKGKAPLDGGASSRVTPLSAANPGYISLL